MIKLKKNYWIILVGIGIVVIITLLALTLIGNNNPQKMPANINLQLSPEEADAKIRCTSQGYSWNDLYSYCCDGYEADSDEYQMFCPKEASGSSKDKVKIGGVPLR